MLGYKPSRVACFFALCAAGLFGIFALPFDTVSSGVKAVRIRKIRKTRAAAAQSGKTTASCKAHAQTKKSDKGKDKAATKPNDLTPRRIEEREESSLSYTAYHHTPKRDTVLLSHDRDKTNEDTPKSTPKNEKDQYIRKRMTIAWSSYCDATVLAKLQIGSYFDLSKEPDNPYDKNAVALLLDGERIGYVAKKDLAPFTVFFNLGKSIYGVITDITTTDNRVKYEYEAWFDRTEQ
jgi:hypothetical protein